MIKAKKKFGQNFLADKNILDTIVLFAGVTPGSNVLEIGPGRGALTEALLAAGALVKAIELDEDLVPVLLERFGKHPSFSLEQGDVLQLSLGALYPEGGYHVVANIPYYITAPIIQKLLTETPAPESITLLVQKEVAERLGGGAKTRSVLTVAAQFYSTVTLGPVIPRTYFDPVPKVDSQLVTLVPRRSFHEGDRDFFRVVKAGFSARRKTLFNNIVASRLASKEKLEGIFTTLSWPMTRRAQELEVAEWEQLATELSRAHI